MLRNTPLPGWKWLSFILNEVLSLNAQECQEYRPRMAHLQFLNEVLSLNAQESVTCYANR